MLELSNQAALMKIKMEAERARMDALQMKESADIFKSDYGARSAAPEYNLRIRPALNGGFAVWLDQDMYVANDAEELAKVVIVAIAKKKIMA
jgi:hypothetical protein